MLERCTLAFEVGGIGPRAFQLGLRLEYVTLATTP